MVALEQRRPRCDHAIEFRQQVSNAAVRRVVQQVPRQTRRFVPLRERRDLCAHEQQRGARLRPHPRVQRTEVGEALPVVARHLAQQAALAVHHFVVAERQHETLTEGIQQPERQLAVVESAMHRVVLQVAEGVVHPTHVPLVCEAKAAEFDGVRDLRPGGAFLRNHHCGRRFGGDHRRQLTKEGNCLEILAAALTVRHPTARGPRVVEVEHAGHGIHSQAVDVELVQPIQRVGHQEVAHLVAAVVEHVRTPVGVLTLARVGVLVESRAVETGEAPFVLREVGRHPVDDHADATPVEDVDHRPQLVGSAVARRRRVVAADLIAPRATERVLGDGQ